MYQPNQKSKEEEETNNSPPQTLANVLAQLPRPQRHRPRTPQLPRIRHQPHRLPIPNLRLNPLRRLHPRPSPLQHAHHAPAPFLLHVRLHVPLGRRLWPHRTFEKFCRVISHEILFGSRGSTVLSRGVVYFGDFLYEKRVGDED